MESKYTKAHKGQPRQTKAGQGTPRQCILESKYTKACLGRFFLMQKQTKAHQGKPRQLSGLIIHKSKQRHAKAVYNGIEIH